MIHSIGTTVRSAAYLFGVEGETGEFAFETREPFPIEFQFAEYDDPATDAWVKQMTLRQGSVTLKTIAEDLLAVVDDPRVNDDAQLRGLAAERRVDASAPGE